MSINKSIVNLSSRRQRQSKLQREREEKTGEEVAGGTSRERSKGYSEIVKEVAKNSAKKRKKGSQKIGKEVANNNEKKRMRGPGKIGREAG